jgi:benzylsuccinate CoA-transferase BbsF subunit
MTPALLDYSANDRVMTCDGNRHPHLCPHGVYPTVGDDRWIAVVCQDDGQWCRLAMLMDRPDLATDPALATSEQRLARADEVDELVASWTAGADGQQLAQALQESGVAAHIVATGADCLADPQLAATGHFVRPPHPDRACLIENTRFRLSRTPSRVDIRAPFLGEHTWDILSEILGYDAERIGELAAAELLE